MSRLPYLVLPYLICLVAALAFPQGEYSNSLLSVKSRFAANEIRAIAEPFRGVATSKGVTPGLFPIRSTGVSTEPVQKAANAFLDSLTPKQLIRTLFAVDDPEWRRWCNVDVGIYVRQGVSLEEMTDNQRKAAIDLLRVSLSAKGLKLSKNIMKTDQALREINNDMLIYGEDKYFLTVMGLPSATAPWGWQLDGHHLIINYFVLADQVVMTPTFLGGEPVIIESGKYEGTSILQDEQNQGLALIQSMNDGQRAKAIVQAEKTRDNTVAAAFRDNLTLDYIGLPSTEMSAIQRGQMLKLIGLFVGNMNEGHARVRMAEIEQHLDETYFAWIGQTSEDAVFYYRIHSPVILIEFDHQRPVGTRQINPPGIPTRQHIHTVVRTPNGNDYGKDLLRQHLENYKH